MNEQRSGAGGQAWAHAYANSLLPATPPDVYVTAPDVVYLPRGT